MDPIANPIVPRRNALQGSWPPVWAPDHGEDAMSAVDAALALAVPLNASDHMLGPADAPVTVIEYGDFECPASFEAYRAMKLLHAHYGRRMLYAFRHLPLTELHPHAGYAAEAAEAAGAQGKFWEMHDQLFDHREHLNPCRLPGFAEELELDMPRFDFELRHRLHRQRIGEHVAGGRLSGARSTPAFFVDGVPVDVAVGMKRLLEAIDLCLHLRAQPQVRARQARANR